jgi:hypothetical protein
MLTGQKLRWRQKDVEKSFSNTFRAEKDGLWERERDVGARPSGRAAIPHCRKHHRRETLNERNQTKQRTRKGDERCGWRHAKDWGNLRNIFTIILKIRQKIFPAPFHSPSSIIIRSTVGIPSSLFVRGWSWWWPCRGSCSAMGWREGRASGLGRRAFPSSGVREGQLSCATTKTRSRFSPPPSPLRFTSLSQVPSLPLPLPLLEIQRDIVSIEKLFSISLKWWAFPFLCQETPLWVFGMTVAACGPSSSRIHHLFSNSQSTFFLHKSLLLFPNSRITFLFLVFLSRFAHYFPLFSLPHWDLLSFLKGFKQSSNIMCRVRKFLMVIKSPFNSPLPGLRAMINRLKSALLHFPLPRLFLRLLF